MVQFEQWLHLGLVVFVEYIWVLAQSSGLSFWVCGREIYRIAVNRMYNPGFEEGQMQTNGVVAACFSLLLVSPMS